MAEKKARGAPEARPWLPTEYSDEDVGALKALARGDCPEHQQRRAMKFIVEQLCGVYDLEFRPGPEGDRESAFAGGKRWVGLQIVKMVNLPSKRSEQ